MTPLTEFLDPALIHRLNQLQLMPRNIAEGSGGGPRRSVRYGASIEFGQHRAFVKGDQPRRIDWRVLARTGKYFVREAQQETIARVMLCLDGSGSMGYRRTTESKLKYAQRILAAMAYLLLSRREAVGLTVSAQAVDQWLPPSSAGTQLALILDALARVKLRTPVQAADAFGSIADRLQRRSLVVIASDLLQPADLLIRSLVKIRHRRHEVLLLRVLDADELLFPFTSATQFEGLEQERPVLRNASLLRQTYLRRFAGHAMELRKACDQNQIELHELQTDIPIQETLMQVLSGRTGSV